MNSVLSYVVVAFVCVTLGYMSYPLLNSEQLSHSTVNTPTVSSDTTSQSPNTPTMVTVQADLTSTQPNLADVQNADKVAPPAMAKPSSTPVIPAPMMAGSKENTAPTASSAELSPWQQARSDEIANLVAEHVPKQIAPFFAEKVLEDNPFLSESFADEQSSDDEQWALDMEQRLRDFIALHEKGYDIELHNVRCQYKACEFLGKSIEPNSWHEITFGVYGYLAEQGISFQSEESKNLSFTVDGEAHFYTIFVFG